MTDQAADQLTEHAAIGYAVIEDREGDYAAPDPRRVALVSDAYVTADQSDLTDDQARQHAHGVAAMIADHLNRRDAEISDVVTWRVVALVPVNRP